MMDLLDDALLSSIEKPLFCSQSDKPTFPLIQLLGAHVGILFFLWHESLRFCDSNPGIFLKLSLQCNICFCALHSTAFISVLGHKHRNNFSEQTLPALLTVKLLKRPLGSAFYFNKFFRISAEYFRIQYFYRICPSLIALWCILPFFKP